MDVALNKRSAESQELCDQLCEQGQTPIIHVASVLCLCATTRDNSTQCRSQKQMHFAKRFVGRHYAGKAQRQSEALKKMKCLFFTFLLTHWPLCHLVELLHKSSKASLTLFPSSFLPPILPSILEALSTLHPECEFIFQLEKEERRCLQYIAEQGNTSTDGVYSILKSPCKPCVVVNVTMKYTPQKIFTLSS